MRKRMKEKNPYIFGRLHVNTANDKEAYKRNRELSSDSGSCGSGCACVRACMLACVHERSPNMGLCVCVQKNLNYNFIPAVINSCF